LKAAKVGPLSAFGLETAQQTQTKNPTEQSLRIDSLDRLESMRETSIFDFFYSSEFAVILQTSLAKLYVYTVFSSAG
jgi:hypothetical protein